MSIYLLYFYIVSSTFLFAASYNYDLVLKSSYPADGQKLSSLSHIDLEFDLSNYTTEENKDEIGMMAIVAKNRIKIYKGGDAESGELLGSCPSKLTRVAYEAGTTGVSINLGTTYELDDGVLYTIVLPQAIAGAYDGSTYLSYNSAINITVYGGEEEKFNFLNSTPTNGAEVKEFGIIKLGFNDIISLADEAQATLYAGEEQLATSKLNISDNDSRGRFRWYFLHGYKNILRSYS